jgi:CRP-like cAMP-binding protein
VVQSAGQGWRLRAAAIRDEFNDSAPVMHLMLRYTQALITQMAQTAVCNRHHVLDQQLCRWLLLSLDRLGGDELRMTQELIANMLGVRREGVTEAALKLQRDGLIRYSRGHITVLDRAGLEARTCECYEVVRKEYARLLPDLTAV